MNRYALASLLPPSGTRPDCSSSCFAARCRDESVAICRSEIQIRLNSSIPNFHPFLERDMKKGTTQGVQKRELTPSLSSPRNTWSVSQKRFYRPISCGADSLRMPAYAHAHTRTCTYMCGCARADTHAHAHREAWIYSGRMEPPTHHHLYRLHMRWRGRWFAEQAVLRERTTKREEIACPCLRSVSFAASFIALRWRPTM